MGIKKEYSRIQERTKKRIEQEYYYGSSTGSTGTRSCPNPTGRYVCATKY